MTTSSSSFRVLVVAGFRESDLPSGEEIAARAHATYLDTLPSVQVETCFITVPRGGSWFAQLSGLCWSFSAMRKVKQAVLDHDPDIVHFHSPLPILSFAPMYWVKRHGKRVVMTLHNVRFACSEGAFYYKGASCTACLTHSPWMSLRRRCVHGSLLKSMVLMLVQRLFIRSGLISRWVDKFVAVSPFIRETHIKLGVDPDRITVIPNQVKYVNSTTKSSRQHIVFVGRFTRSKGAHLVLEACRALPQFSFVCIGADEDGLLADVAYPNLDVRPVMSHDDVMATLDRDAALVLVPSICSESFSLIAAEAMGLGIPVIGSQYGNLPALIEQYGGGVSIDLSKPMALAEAITQVLEHDDQYQIFSQKGRQYGKKNISNDWLKDRYMQEYQLVSLG